MAVLTGSIADQLIAEQGANVVIPEDTYTSIENSAFFSKFVLDTIEIPESIVTIGDYAFKGNNLTEVTIPEGVKSIGQMAFSTNRLETIVIPSSISSIPYGAFLDNKLTSINIPNNITSIGEKAFYGNTIKSVTISENVTSLGDNAFDTSTVVVNLGNGKVIGPDDNQYKVLQGVLPHSTSSNGIVRGGETFGTRDIFLLPNVANGAPWSFDTGFADQNDYFLIDQKVDISKVAQFANCIWYDEGWEGEPLFDTRNDPNYFGYSYYEGDNYEMAFYSDWDRTAPQPSQFGSIDLSGINLNLIQGMSDDDFLDEYAYAITAYDLSSDLSQATGNPTDLNVSSSRFDENIPRDSAIATLSSSDPNTQDTHTYSLIAGSGDTDNNLFTIDGNQIKIKESPDFENQFSYSIRLQSQDSVGLIFEKEFIFTVNELDETPTPVTTPTTAQTPALVPTPIQKLQSIDDITTQIEITTFQLNNSVRFQNQQVEMLIRGTDKKDKITGSSIGELINGGKGKDVLKGGGGSDGFLFDAKAFGKKTADKILDFNSDEGDSILVDNEVFDLGKKVKLKTVASKIALKKAFASNKEFVYDVKKGFLYFNENGKEKGWGDGGLFVKLQGAPELGTTDFTII